LSRLLAELVEHFRNVLVLQAGVQPSQVTADELAEIEEHARMIHRTRTLRILEILTETENQMKWALSKKILFEVALVKVIETKDEVLLEEVLKRLKEAETSHVAGGTETEKAENPAQKVATTSLFASNHSAADAAAPAPFPRQKMPLPQPAGQPATPVDVSFEKIWKELLDQLAKYNSMLRSNIVEGRPISMDATTLVIGFDPEFKLEKESVDTPRSRETIQAILRELTRKAMNVKVVFADDPSIPCGDECDSSHHATQEHSLPKNAESPDKRFEDDPQIRKALEIFKGEIVEIRR